MLSLLAAMMLAPMTPPGEELARQLFGRIWYDLQSNALIGNDNELAANWANAGADGETRPQLHILNLMCSNGATHMRCRFDLLRDGGIATYLGETVPDRLACRVTFLRSATTGQWSIPRLPPGPRGGHTSITIHCRVARA